MASLIPIVIILLALVAAGSIAYIAWELSSDKFHNSLFGDDKTDRDD